MRYLLLLALLTNTATADDVATADDAAPDEAAGKIIDKVVAATNQFLDRHVDLLTYDMLQLRVDAVHRAAKINVGGGHAKLLKLRVAGDVEVVDGTARIKSRVGLAIGGKQMSLRLPSVDVAPAEYRGERGVEVRLPLVRRAF